jgi:HEAT repeat protein
MGFFDVFLSEEKKIAKNRRRLTSRDSQPEDREAAARWLAANGSPKALLALVSRFDMKLEHQLNDKAERDVVIAIVLQLGDAAVKPLRSWLKQCRSVSVPLRLLEELTDEASTITFVYKLLERELAREDFKPEKKHALLTWLGDRRHEGAVAAAAPFIDDFDENVRCVAAEVLIAQEDPAVAEILEARIANEEEDSNRLRHRVAEVFAARRWPLTDPSRMAGALPDGYQVSDGFVVAR